MKNHNEKWIVSGSALPVDELKLDFPAFKEGMQAFSDGVGFYQNPYEPRGVVTHKNPLGVYWRNGFLYGRYDRHLRGISRGDWPENYPLMFLYWDGKAWTQDLALARRYTSLHKAEMCGYARLGEAQRNGSSPLAVVWMVCLTDSCRSYPLPHKGGEWRMDALMALTVGKKEAASKAAAKAKA